MPVEQRDHLLARCTAKGKDPAVLVPARMDPVGQQRPGKPALEIDPQTRAGEARMADGVGRAGIAAVPAGIGPSQPTVRFSDSRGADGLDGVGRQRRAVEEDRAKSSTPSMVPNRPAWPDAPPSAKAFSSCTSPRITRPRQVSALGRGAELRIGPEREAFGQRLIDQRLPGDALDGDAEQDEVDVGIDRRPASARRAAG